MFKFFANDNKIVQKILVLYGLLILCGVILFISLLNNIIGLIGIVLLLIIAIAMSGYWLSCVKAISLNTNNIVLPFFNFKSCISLGFRNAIANFLYYLVFLIPAIIFGLLAFIKILEPIAYVLAFLTITFLLFLETALCWIFVQTNDLKAYWKIKKAIELTSYAKLQYTKSVLVLWGINVLFSILTSNKIIPNDKITLAFSLIYILLIPIIMLITAWITAKSIKPECVDKLI